MDTLEKTRKEITNIDRKMAKLFVKRMKLVKHLARYKQSQNLQVYAPEREAEIFKTYKNWIKDENLQEYYLEFLNQTISISHDFQNNFLKERDANY